MPTMTRQERSELIARDPNDASDEVWIGATSKSKRRYHADPECFHLPSSPRRVSRETAQKRLWPPCRDCHDL